MSAPDKKDCEWPWSERRPENQFCAYYYSFEPTGCEAIDNVLRAVAYAGKQYHHTDQWGEDALGHEDGEPTMRDLIQEAAVHGAALIARGAPAEADRERAWHALRKAACFDEDECEDCVANVHRIATMLAKVRAEEREACATKADEFATMMDCGAGEDWPGHRFRQLARLIRAQGER